MNHAHRVKEHTGEGLRTALLYTFSEYIQKAYKSHTKLSCSCVHVGPWPDKYSTTINTNILNAGNVTPKGSKMNFSHLSCVSVCAFGGAVIARAAHIQTKHIKCSSLMCHAHTGCCCTCADGPQPGRHNVRLMCCCGFAAGRCFAVTISSLFAAAAPEPPMTTHL